MKIINILTALVAMLGNIDSGYARSTVPYSNQNEIRKTFDKGFAAGARSSKSSVLIIDGLCFIKVTYEGAGAKMMLNASIIATVVPRQNGTRKGGTMILTLSKDTYPISEPMKDVEDLLAECSGEKIEDQETSLQPTPVKAPEPPPALARPK